MARHRGETELKVVQCNLKITRTVKGRMERMARERGCSLSVLLEAAMTALDRELPRRGRDDGWRHDVVPL